MAPGGRGMNIYEETLHFAFKRQKNQSQLVEVSYFYL